MTAISARLRWAIATAAAVLLTTACTESPSGPTVLAPAPESATTAAEPVPEDPVGPITTTLFSTGTSPPVTVLPGTTAAITIAPNMAAGWVRISNNDAVFGTDGRQAMLDVVAGGPGFVAVGYENRNAAVWTSTDGLVWERVPHRRERFGGEGNQQMSAVATAGPGLVAVGTDNDDAAIWTSPDGLDWTRVATDDPDLRGDGTQFITDVTGVRNGIVAVGGGGSGPVAFRSTDGLDWERIELVGEARGDEVSLFINRILEHDGGLIAVGQGFGEQTGMRAIVWRSDDGGSWSRLLTDPDDPAGPSAALRDVVAGGPGLVGVGSEVGDQAPIWVSADDEHGSRADNPDRAFYRRDVRAIVATDRGLVAVGTEDGTIVSWVSTDGVSWTFVDTPEWIQGRSGSVTIEGATAKGTRIVAVGHSVDVDAAVLVWDYAGSD